ncbi:hypothetical protein K1719_033457 [Acacia pycnantha]|nr:hypothetical protein K1719_033457 [Acacia pycnantha]
MGKKGGTSWLTAIKRAFRSPTKDTNKRKHEDNNQDATVSIHHTLTKQNSDLAATTAGCVLVLTVTVSMTFQNNVLSMPMAKAEVAMVIAQAAVEADRLKRPLNSARKNYVATVIQTTLRGYLPQGAQAPPQVHISDPDEQHPNLGQLCHDRR